MLNTFVFRLQNGYYYIGNTDNVNKSFHSLMQTLENKPIGIERIIENGSMDCLISLTKMYIDLYGKDKVRSPIVIDWISTDELEKSRKQSLLMSQTKNYSNCSELQNITVLDYMISLRNNNVICGRRCPCINRLCPQIDTESD